MRTVELDAHHLFDLVVDCVEGMPMSFHSNGIDATVRAASTCHQLQLFENVLDVLVVEDLGVPVLLREPEPFRKTIDGNDAFGAEETRAGDGEETHRSGAPYRDNITVLDVAVLGGHVSSGKNVGEKE